MPVVVLGGTGYVGRPLIERLLARGHEVTALARPASRERVPAGARVVAGSALSADDVAGALSDGCSLVLLVGTPHPSPAKAKQFREVDLVAARSAAEAASRFGRVAHIVYRRTSKCVLQASGC
jgi:nucleoside-diphosphate-sugar epimerase